MSSSLRRGAIAAVILAAIVPLSACAADTGAETLQVKPDNPETSLGNDLKLNEIVVVTTANAVSGRPGPADVTVDIANTGKAAETLQSVTVGQGTAALFTDAKGAPLSQITVPAGGAVLLGGPGQPVVHVTSVDAPVGGFMPVTFSFGTAGQVTAQAQVQPATGNYASFGPTGVPSGTPSAGASASASAGASTSGSAASPAVSASSSAPGSPAAH